MSDMKVVFRGKPKPRNRWSDGPARESQQQNYSRGWRQQEMGVAGIFSGRRISQPSEVVIKNYPQAQHATAILQKVIDLQVQLRSDGDSSLQEIDISNQP